MWQEIKVDNISGLSRFGQIQRSMGGNYMKFTLAHISDLYRRKNNIKAFVYDTTDYQITLMFGTRLTHPIAKSKGRIQIMAGGFESIKSNSEGMKIACTKIKEYLVSQSRNGYALIDSIDLDPKVTAWYAEIEAGMQSVGIKWSQSPTYSNLQYFDL